MNTAEGIDAGPVAILGLGLVGGSLARDLARLDTPVLGWDRNGGAVGQALQEQVLVGALGPALQGLEEASVVVLALPVDVAPTLLRQLAPMLERARLVTDVGSTKRSIMEAAAAAGLGERFVGSHPLAGDHRSGWNASREGLFAGHRIFLTTNGPGALETEALQRAKALWRSVGGEPEVVDAGEHDNRMAWVSHLPQLAASAVALVLGGNGFSAADLGPGGRDVIRLAASSPELWAAIIADNRDEIALAVRSLSTALLHLASLAEEHDTAQLRALLAAAAAAVSAGA